MLRSPIRGTHNRIARGECRRSDAKPVSSGMQAPREKRSHRTEQQEAAILKSQQKQQRQRRMGGDTSIIGNPNSENSRQSLSKSLMQALKICCRTRRARKGQPGEFRSSPILRACRIRATHANPVQERLTRRVIHGALPTRNRRHTPK